MDKSLEEKNEIRNALILIVLAILYVFSAALASASSLPVPYQVIVVNNSSQGSNFKKTKTNKRDLQCAKTDKKTSEGTTNKISKDTNSSRCLK